MPDKPEPTSFILDVNTLTFDRILGQFQSFTVKCEASSADGRTVVEFGPGPQLSKWLADNISRRIKVTFEAEPQT